MLQVRTIQPDYVFHFMPRVETHLRPSMSLVLSGGGARGVAHIGVLKALEDWGYPIDSIVGCSAGALMGTLFASGYSAREIENLFNNLGFARAFLDPLGRTPGMTLEEQEAENGTLLGIQIERGFPSFALGLNSGREIQRTLEGVLARGAYFSEGNFDRLRMPLRILATNLESGEGHLFSSGNLSEVLRAAMAVPGAFKPMMVGDRQYVDGALVENIPVICAKEAFNPDLVLAVDVSNPMKRMYATNFLSVAARSLDLVIEHKQRQSLAQASLVVRPDMPEVGFVDYGDRLAELVATGTKAFNMLEPRYRALNMEKLPDEDLLPTGDFTLRNRGLCPPHLLELIHELLAPGQPIRKRHVLAIMQQAVVQGWLKDLRARVIEKDTGKVLELVPVPHAPITSFAVEAPDEIRQQILDELKKRFAIGAPFDPATFGRFLNTLISHMVMKDRPLTDLRGSGFDNGVLKVKAHEPRLSAISIQEKDPKIQVYMRELLASLVGQPVRIKQLRKSLDIAEGRLHLAELRYRFAPIEPGKPDGDAELVLTPVHDKPQSLDLILGGATHLGMQVGLRYKALNIIAKGWEIQAEAAKNSLQKEGRLGIHGPFFQAFPGAGFQIKGNLYEQKIENPPLFPTGEIQDMENGSRIRTQDVSAGVFARFGNLGQGKLSLSGTLRKADFHSIFSQATQSSRWAQLALDWDDFDRHTLPRNGLMVRGFLRQGEKYKIPMTPGRFISAYVRARGIKSFGPPMENKRVGMDLDAEWGYGRHLPLDQWWCMGGSAFMVGSKPLGHMAPNFLVMRFGTPIDLAGPYGTSLQVVPRLDYALAGVSPGSLFKGQRALGTGMALRSMISQFYMEFSLGLLKTRIADEWKKGQWNFSIMAGTQPFDLWKRR